MKVTIVTPVYNGEDTIQDCIDSVKMQDYPDIEHIIIDGESTDNTIEIVKNNKIKYFSEPDAGIYDAFNKGIQHSTGDIIHILNSDDMYAEKNVVSKMIQHMLAKKLDVIHGYAEQVDNNMRIVKRVGKEMDKNELLCKMRVAHPATFVRKSTYIKYGTYSVGFTIAADHEFLLRIWDKVALGFLPIVVTKMRLGGASNSQITLSYKESLAAEIIHGKGIIPALLRYYLELIKNIIRPTI